MNPISNFVSQKEQLELTAILNSKNRKPSIETKILYFITLPFSYLASFFRWLTDPNWKNFIAKSRGHFSERYQRYFPDSLKKTNAIFDSHLMRYTSEKPLWHYIHTEAKKMNKNDYWKIVKSGTCFGNCVTLANQILSANRFLDVDELKKIEDSHLFVTLSQTAQYTMNLTWLYNIVIIKIQKDASSPTAKNTFALAKKDMPAKNLKIAEKFALFPQINPTKFTKEASIAAFQQSVEKKLSSPKRLKAKGIFLIGAHSSKRDAAHAMLLEFDNEKKCYIFYDNNFGYYRWNRLNDCLSGIRTHLQRNAYDKARTCRQLLMT